MLEDAVRAYNEYLQIQTDRSFVPSHMMAMIEDGGKEEEHSVSPMQGSIDPERSIDPMSLMVETLQKLVEKVDTLSCLRKPGVSDVDIRATLGEIAERPSGTKAFLGPR